MEWKHLGIEAALGTSWVLFGQGFFSLGSFCLPTMLLPQSLFLLLVHQSLPRQRSTPLLQCQRLTVSVSGYTLVRTSGRETVSGQAHLFLTRLWPVSSAVYRVRWSGSNQVWSNQQWAKIKVARGHLLIRAWGEAFPFLRLCGWAVRMIDILSTKVQSKNLNNSELSYPQGTRSCVSVLCFDQIN